MFKIEELEEILELAKRADDKVMRSVKKFTNEFPDCSFDDYKKVFKRLAMGKTIDELIEKYREHQYEIGQKMAREEMESMKTVFMMKDLKDEMLHDLRYGKEKGSSTYIDKLDNAWTWRLGEFNIWTGYVNEGKSLFLRFLALVKAIKDQWKFAFYAPEDFPAKEFFDDIIHTASGYSTDKDQDNFIREELYIQMMKRLNPYFYFVYVRPPKNTIINIMKEFVPLIHDNGVKVCIIDPLIKVKRPKEFMNADDKYAGYATTLATDFSRMHNISLHLVMHQLTPRLQENGLYAPPTYYNIKGGGTWADGSDNVNAVQRPLYARDKIDAEVIFSAMKIKKQKLVGIPQNITYAFDRRKNRYVDFNTRKDIFDFDGHLRVPRMGLLWNT
jgi:twinkle protein